MYPNHAVSGKSDDGVLNTGADLILIIVLVVIHYFYGDSFCGS